MHELCELKLHRYLGDMLPGVIEQMYAAHKDNDFYSGEAESVTDEYVSFCVEIIEAVRSGCTDPLILVEHRLDYSEYVPEGFGTGDLIIVADGVLEIIDFKGGRGVRVEADHNPQLMLYALGALLEFDPLYDIHTVRMSIVQPRLSTRPAGRNQQKLPQTAAKAPSAAKMSTMLTHPAHSGRTRRAGVASQLSGKTAAAAQGR